MELLYLENGELHVLHPGGFTAKASFIGEVLRGTGRHSVSLTTSGGIG